MAANAKHIFSAVLAATLLVGGCRKEDMAQQPRYEPMSPSAFFAAGKSARPLVPGTVDRNGVVSTAYISDENAGMEYGGDFPPDFPRSGDALRAKLLRGRERYSIYCAVCHGDLGDGRGMVAQRGFVRPPAFYPNAADNVDSQPGRDLYAREQGLIDPKSDRHSPGHIYNAITNAYGAMYSYAARVAPEDRWAIAAYIRVLQSSQYAEAANLPPGDRQKVKAGIAADAADATQPTRTQP